MSAQKIEAPYASDIDGIARALIHAEHVIIETLGSKLNGSRADLLLIERMLDAGIRYKLSTFLAYPRTMISRRIEDGEPVDVIELFDGLCRRMEKLVEKGWL